MLSTVVVSIVGEDQLAEMLPVIHRARFGNVTRVIRTHRRDAIGQLRRAGIPTGHAPDAVIAASTVVFANCAGRASQFARICLDFGANSTWIVSVDGPWSPVDDRILAIEPVRDSTPRPHQIVPGRATAIPDNQAGDPDGISQPD